jgi:hypothetical protein
MFEQHFKNNYDNGYLCVLRELCAFVFISDLARIVHAKKIKIRSL